MLKIFWLTFLAISVFAHGESQQEVFDLHQVQSEHSSDQEAFKISPWNGNYTLHAEKSADSLGDQGSEEDADVSNM